MDTIFATSSGTPPAAIAIVRVTGPAAFVAGRALAGSLPPPRRAALRALHDPRDGRLLDRALVLVFAGPATSTGDDVVELHVHGGRAVVAAVEETLAVLPGLRRAEAGEFTRRALMNGVIDLTEAEGLGDLLSAETEGQRRAALRLAEGGLRSRIETWTTHVIAVAAQVEAQLDFSDEDDVATTADVEMLAPVARILNEIEVMLAEPPVERLRDGLRVVLAGPPNSGKSSLLNAMIEREAAIVSPIAGTTRDRIEAPVTRNGIAYVLTDTAGLTDSPGDVVERIGIDRARAAVVEADVLLWLGDDRPPADAIWVHARSDLLGRSLVPPAALAVSAKTQFGLPALWQVIHARSQLLLPRNSDIVANARQRGELSVVVDVLSRSTKMSDLLIVAECLRLALAAFDRVTGRGRVEDVLDALFAQFCVGK